MLRLTIKTLDDRRREMRIRIRIRLIFVVVFVFLLGPAEFAQSRIISPTEASLAFGGKCGI
jgi:hypothetical protein